MYSIIRSAIVKSPMQRRLRKDRSGAAAVEFSMVVLPFLMLMFSIFEVGWFFYVNSIVDASVAEASRLIKTGQIQQMAGSDDEKYDTIYNTVCNILDDFGNCDTRLTIESQTYANFSELAADNSAATCADAPPNMLDIIPFELGEERSIVRVRICFIYETINPAIGVNVSEPGTNKKRLISTMIFRNEPYEKGSG